MTGPASLIIPVKGKQVLEKPRRARHAHPKRTEVSGLSFNQRLACPTRPRLCCFHQKPGSISMCSLNGHTLALGRWQELPDCPKGSSFNTSTPNRPFKSKPYPHVSCVFVFAASRVLSKVLCRRHSKANALCYNWASVMTAWFRVKK